MEEKQKESPLSKYKRKGRSSPYDRMRPVDGSDNPNLLDDPKELIEKPARKPSPKQEEQPKKVAKQKPRSKDTIQKKEEKKSSNARTFYVPLDDETMIKLRVAAATNGMAIGGFLKVLIEEEVKAVKIPQVRKVT